MGRVDPVRTRGGGGAAHVGGGARDFASTTGPFGSRVDWAGRRGVYRKATHAGHAEAAGRPKARRT
jgi:hypothetical protein